jgi:exopolysaccharide production protein ExoZ
LSERPIDLATILSSLAFLPSYLGPNTLQTTVIPVGWTLVYEAFFYALFAAGIASKVGSRGVIAVIVVLALLHPLATGFYAQHYTSPLLLEFALGACVAALPPPPKGPAALGIAAIGLVLLLIGAHHGLTTPFRPLACGPGAALMVYGCTAADWPQQRIIALLGDASYSIYLFHLYPMKYVGVKALHVTSLPVLVALGTGGGVLLYLLVERPLQRLVKRWNWGRGRAYAAVSA